MIFNITTLQNQINWFITQFNNTSPIKIFIILGNGANEEVLLYSKVIKVTFMSGHPERYLFFCFICFTILS